MSPATIPAPRKPNAAVIDRLYKPLRHHPSDNNVREIRILVIESTPPPETIDQPIVCSLRVVTVAEAQTAGYYALSYVWGDQYDTHPMLVNGLPFQATHNLVEALQHVAEVEPACRDRGLWVDAVCINQTDNHEKSAQVAMMKDIYTGAHETLAWLGPGDSQSRAAFGLVNRIYGDKAAMGGDGSGTYTFDEESRPRPELLAQPDVLDLINDLGKDSLFTTDIFSRRAYWYRIWTLQELILGSRIRLIAGSDSCTRDAAFGVRLWIISKPVLAFIDGDPPYNKAQPDDNDPVEQVRSFLLGVRKSANNLTHFNQQCNAYRFTKLHGGTLAPPIRAMSCLRAAMTRYSCDERDMIFGLCGIEDFGVTVDYDMSTRELFCRVAAWLAVQMGGVGGNSMLQALLNYAGVCSRESEINPPLPSWVPDWNVRPTQCLVHTLKDNSDVPADLAVKVSDDRNTLHLHGVYLGKIQSVSRPGICPGLYDRNEARTEMSISKQLEKLADMAEFLAGTKADNIVDMLVAAKDPDEVTPRTHGQSFFITLFELLADPYRPKHQTYTVHDLVSLLHCLVKSGKVKQTEPTNEQDHEQNPGEETLKAVLDETRTEALDRDTLLREAAFQFQKPGFDSRLFGVEEFRPQDYVYFRTEDGLMGYAANVADAGDVVYMVAGAQDLLVLRPVDGKYQFLSVGLIPGFGGYYRIDWENPPGKVEAIDVV